MPVLTDKQISHLRSIAEGYARGDNATLGVFLGAGASAAVFEATRQTQRSAVKVYEPDFFQGPHGAVELRRLRLQERLIGHNCAYLVQINAVRAHEDTCIVEMEHVQGPDLSAVLRDVPRLAIQPLIYQLAAAARFLESQRLVHRDIKPQNIKVSADFTSLKLLDLGVVREFEHDSGPDATEQGRRRPFVATAQYSSPDYLFWLHPPSEDLWRGLSIYQVGAVLHDLIRQSPLFADEVAMDNRYALAMAVLHKVPSTHSGEVASWLCALAARCLTKDLYRRLEMVSWDDFEDAGNRTETVIRRFRQVGKAGIEPLQEAARAHERLLERERLMDAVSDSLTERVGETLGTRQFERVSGQCSRRVCVRITNTNVILDYAIAFVWMETELDNTATLTVSACVRPDNTEFQPASNKSVGTLTANTLQDATDVLYTSLIDKLGLGLDVLQLNGDLTEVVFLT